MQFVKKHVFKIAVLALCAAMAAYLLMSMDYGNKPLNKYGEAPSFELTDLDGNTVSLEDTQGKVRLYYFYFSYCPDVCPPTTAQLASVQEEMISEGKFGSEVILTSITIDPQRDTPERIREYAGKFDADFSGWHFLRGDEAQTHEIAKSFGLSVIKDGDQFFHTNIVFLVDRDGYIRKFIKDDMSTDENELTSEQMIQDVKRLLKES